MSRQVAERKVMCEATVKAVAGEACAKLSSRINFEDVFVFFAGRIPLLVHVGACPIADAIELAKHAKVRRVAPCCLRSLTHEYCALRAAGTRLRRHFLRRAAGQA